MNFIPILKGELSFAQIRIPDKKTKIAFSSEENNTVVIITSNGNYYKVSFDPVKGGECKDVKQEIFFNY